MRSAGMIQADAPHEIRISPFDALNRRENHTGVAEIDSAIAVQVVHSSVTVGVDVDVGGVTELVAALPCATARIAQRKIILRRPEPGEDAHLRCRYASVFQILNDELELVDEGLTKNDVLGPDIFLIVGQEIAQTKVL